MSARYGLVAVLVLALSTSGCEGKYSTTTTQPQCRDPRVPARRIPCPQVGGVTERVQLLNVVGMTETQAQTLLNQRGLLVTVTVRPETHPPWPQPIVVAQDPVAGSTVLGGSTVTLIVSG